MGSIKKQEKQIKRDSKQKRKKAEEQRKKESIKAQRETSKARRLVAIDAEGKNTKKPSKQTTVRLFSGATVLIMGITICAYSHSKAMNAQISAWNQYLLETIDTLRKENSELETRIFDLEFAHLELQKLLYEEKSFYSPDELRCIEVIDKDGSHSFKIVALIEGNIAAVDKQPHLDYFNSVYEKGPAFRVTDDRVDYFYDIKANEIVGNRLHFELNDCPDEEITPVTGAYYTRTSIDEQVETEIGHAEGLIEDFSNRQTTEGTRWIIVRYLSQALEEGEEKGVWTVDEIEKLEARLNGMTPRERFLQFDPGAKHFLNS